MSAEARLHEAARATTGDETIIDVAIFHPKGYSGKTGSGAAAGSLLGDSAIGTAIGAAAGAAAGMAAGSSRLPRSVCVAITPERVYLLKHKGATDFAGDLEPPFATLDRSELGVEVHQRAMNRVVILHDGETDTTYELEAPRLGPYHAKALVRLLMVGPDHVEDPVD